MVNIIIDEIKSFFVGYGISFNDQIRLLLESSDEGEIEYITEDEIKYNLHIRYDDMDCELRVVEILPIKYKQQGFIRISLVDELGELRTYVKFGYQGSGLDYSIIDVVSRLSYNNIGLILSKYVKAKEDNGYGDKGFGIDDLNNTNKT